MVKVLSSNGCVHVLSHLCMYLTDVQIEHENEGEKNEVIDSSQCEDGDGAAWSDEGFDDTEQEHPMEGDIVTPVQESVDHQISQGKVL